MSDQGRTIRPRLLHVEEAAQMLALGRTKTYELIAKGELHVIRLGRATRVSDDEVNRFIQCRDRQVDDDHPQPAVDGRRGPASSSTFE